MPTAARVDGPVHRVLVYDVEAQLIETAGGFLSDVLGDGGAAVALASEEHLRALERWVGLCAPRVGPAAAEQRYHAVSIDEALAGIDQDPNPAAIFEARLQEVLDRIPGELTPVHVFGEVAAALWERGRVEAALGVEATSSGVCATRPVSLLCAYPQRILVDDADVEQACGHHTAVLNAPSFPAAPPGEVATLVSSAVLPPAPAACRTARQLVRAAFERGEETKAIAAAELVVGELAANAVRHAGSTFTAEVSLRNGAVRLAVTDAVPLPSDWDGFPVARAHGLGVVAALAEDWAVQPLAGGKLVWADVAREER